MKYCPECSNYIECNAYKDKDTGMWGNVWECSVHGKVNPCNNKNDTEIDLDMRFQRHIRRMRTEILEAIELEKQLNQTYDLPWWETPTSDALPLGSCPVIDLTYMNKGEQNEK